MDNSRLIIGGLATLLVVTNGWWAYSALDQGTSITYTQAALDTNKKALAQSLAVIEAAVQPDATKQAVIEAAAQAADDDAMELVFEKDGYLFVGRLGLKFGSGGDLVAVRRSWNPP